MVAVFFHYVTRRFLDIRKFVYWVHFVEKGQSLSNVNLLDRKSIRLIDNFANYALTFGMKSEHHLF